MKIRTIYTLIILTIVSLPALGQTVIVNNSNPVSQLTKAELRNIYLGNTSTWENSSQIIIVDYTADNDLRDSFSDKYLNLSPKKVSMIWIKASLSGKTVPPRVFHTESEIVKFVSENEGAIGYLDNPVKLPPNIKTVQVQ